MCRRERPALPLPVPCPVPYSYSTPIAFLHVVFVPRLHSDHVLCSVSLGTLLATCTPPEGSVRAELDLLSVTCVVSFTLTSHVNNHTSFYTHVFRPPGEHDPEEPTETFLVASPSLRPVRTLIKLVQPRWFFLPRSCSPVWTADPVTLTSPCPTIGLYRHCKAASVTAQPSRPPVPAFGFRHVCSLAKVVFTSPLHLRAF